MANRFWVPVAGSGTGNTSDINHWSATSGGAGGVTVPVAGDVVAFDANSGTGTVTDNAGLTCASITHSKASLTVSASAAQTVTGAVTVTAGSWITGAFTHSYGSFVSTSGTRTLTLDNSTINITGTSGAVGNVSTAGILTFSATGSTINVNGGTPGLSLIVGLGAVSYGTVNITAPGFVSLNGIVTIKNFAYTSTTNKTDSINIGNSLTIAANGSLVITGNSVVNRAFVISNTLGSQRTITVPNTATVTLTNVDFQDIASAGTFGTWTGTSLGDMLGNSGITFDASTSPSLTGTGTINYSTAAIWSTGKVPLPQDDVDFGSSSTATTLTFDMPRPGRNLNAANYLKTLSFASTPNTITGNITLPIGAATLSGTQTLTLAGRGAQTITSNGKTFPQTTISFGAPGGTYTALDAFIGGALSYSSGSFTATDDVTLSIGPSGGGAGTTLTMGNGVWALSRTSGSLWGMGSATTVIAGNSTIKLTGNVSTSITFTGAGLTYNNLWWSSTTATGTLIITGANTLNDLKINRATARGLRLPAGATTTIASWTDESLGTAVLTLDSSSAGVAATISKPGGDVRTDYLSVQDSAATGGANWRAGPHSTSVSGNSGWIFGNVDYPIAASLIVAAAKAGVPVQNAKPSVALLCAAVQSGIPVGSVVAAASLAAAGAQAGQIARATTQSSRVRSADNAVNMRPANTQTSRRPTQSSFRRPPARY